MTGLQPASFSICKKAFCKAFGVPILISALMVSFSMRVLIEGSLLFPNYAFTYILSTMNPVGSNNNMKNDSFINMKEIRTNF